MMQCFAGQDLSLNLLLCFLIFLIENSQMKSVLRKEEIILNFIIG